MDTNNKIINKKNMYYSYLTAEEKQLFKNYCVVKNISSFKMQNYFSGQYSIPQDFKEWLNLKMF